MQKKSLQIINRHLLIMIDQTNKIKSNQDEHDSQSSKPHTQQKPSQNDRKNNHRQER